MKTFLFFFLVFSLFNSMELLLAETQSAPSHFKKATFAGGCFWCMQPPYDELEGVLSSTVGYTGGHKKNPVYEEVCSGTTGHAEAVEILFDPSKITYEELLNVFWRNIDPTVLNRQFADQGNQYRTAIFYHDEDQKLMAETSKSKLEQSGKFRQAIVTEISPASVFYKAEEYHQKYYRKETDQYRFYKKGSGREEYLERVWGEKK